MYQDFFGLSRRPFSLTPDTEFLFWTEQHRRAYDMVCLSLLRSAPIAVITGDVGAGKTTLIQALLDEISAEYEVGLLSNVVGNGGDLLRWILTAYGRSSAPASPAEAMREVETLLREAWEGGRRSVLIVDEAQNVSDEGIETLRLLTNLDVGKCAPLTLILAGQPELRQRLAAPAFTAFRQRLGASAHLGPMTLDETVGYVHARIATAGGDPAVFDRGAVEAVYRRARGVPRLTNMLCDLCFVSAYAEDRARIDAAFAETALAEALALGGLGGLPAEAEEPVEAVTARLAAPAVARPMHVGGAPGLRLADAGAVAAPARPRQSPPPLRLVGAAPQMPAEPPVAMAAPVPVAEAPLRLTGGTWQVEPELHHLPTGSAPAATVSAPPLPVRRRRLIGSAAGLALAASLAGAALLLPATGTGVGRAPAQETPVFAAPPAAIAPAAVATVAVAAPAPAVPTPVALGIAEARRAPPDPAEADRLFARALDISTSDPAEAAVDYSRAAARGHARAAYYLAQMYETGDGVSYAPDIAWNWYAAAAGEVSAAQKRLADVVVASTASDSFAQPMFAAVQDDVVDLVWQGRGSFVVELAPRPDATAFTYATPLTAARLELPQGVAWWRVRAVGATPSAWMPLGQTSVY